MTTSKKVRDYSLALLFTPKTMGKLNIKNFLTIMFRFCCTIRGSQTGVTLCATKIKLGTTRGLVTDLRASVEN